MSIVTNDRGSSHHNLLVNSHHSETATEQTIVTHSVPNAVVTEHPLVKKNDGQSYPTNPTNGYIR